MEFPRRLECILSKEKEHGLPTLSKEHTSVEGSSSVTDLEQWNLDMEAFLKTPPTPSVLSSSIEDPSCYSKQLHLVANQVVHEILRCCGCCNCKDDHKDDDDENCSAIHTTMESTELNRLANVVVNNMFSTQQQEELRFNNECKLFDYIRVGKNLLHWYIQVYLEWQQRQQQDHHHHHQQQQQQAKHLGEPVNDEGDNNDPLRVLQSPPMLELVLNVLKWSVACKKITSELKVNRTRSASLYLFYSTYGINPHDRISQQGMKHLLHLNFPQVAMDMLCQIDSVLVALSLTLNLHNLAVSFPNAASSFLAVSTSRPSNDLSAPWLADMQSLDNATTQLTLVNVCTSLALWCVRPQHTLQNAWIGQKSNDTKRYQLVIEILNMFYALRIGQQLSLSKIRQQTTSVSTFDGHMTQYGLATLVIEVLNLSTTNESESLDDMMTAGSIRQCQLAACSLLMDSDPSFGSYLVEYNHDAFEALLQILQLQVDIVVDQIGINHSAVASLVPVLVVCNKYASANVEVRAQVQNLVFPPEAEHTFQQKIQQQIDGSSSYKVSNMSPLDAPRDTLRGKLVQLLSWPESYIKRCTAELLWTLCNGNATEYINRVGMGNALPMLNAKGIASLPGSLV
jgi:hypothetical protein